MAYEFCLWKKSCVVRAIPEIIVWEGSEGSPDPYTMIYGIAISMCKSLFKKKIA